MTWDEFEAEYPEYRETICSTMNDWMTELRGRKRTLCFDNPRQRLMGFFDLEDGEAFYTKITSVKKALMDADEDLPILAEMGLSVDTIRESMKTSEGRETLCGPSLTLN